ncbi:hypothetical protein [uncultured Desulfovibrio sp.]|uniref:hypothetical protein n=1 Tax=uncultured Desulfovibrio sp. TaxID=167968 RepID=UPI00260D0B48|nr:hypothetical protein [uncultured Desulfovibrio sp.]
MPARKSVLPLKKAHRDAAASPALTEKAVVPPSFLLQKRGSRKTPFSLEHFPFETLRASNHTAWRFAEKARFFRSLLAGRRCAAASRFTFFKGKTL